MALRLYLTEPTDASFFSIFTDTPRSAVRDTFASNAATSSYAPGVLRGVAVLFAYHSEQGFAGYTRLWRLLPPYYIHQGIGPFGGV